MFNIEMTTPEETTRNSLIKCMPAVLDTIFSILCDTQDSEKFNGLEDCVFKAFTKCIRLVGPSQTERCMSRSATIMEAGRRFGRRGSLIADLDFYVQKVFSHTSAHCKLLHTMNNVVENAQSRPQELKNAMEVLGSIIKFAARSCVLYSTKHDGQWNAEFENLLSRSLSSLQRFMTYTAYELHNAQSACMRSIVQSIPDLTEVYSKAKLAVFFQKLVNSLPEGHLLEERLSFIKGLIRSKLFQDSQCRLTLLPVISQEITNSLSQQKNNTCRVRRESEFCCMVVNLVRSDSFNLRMSKYCTDILGDLFDTLHNTKEASNGMARSLTGSYKA